MGIMVSSFLWVMQDLSTVALCDVLQKLCWSLQGAVLYEDRKYSPRPKKFKLSNTEPIYKGKKLKVPLLTI